MKKLTLAAAVLCGIITCSSCKKENVQPIERANSLTDKANLAQADFITQPNSGNKANLGQADGGTD